MGHSGSVVLMNELFHTAGEMIVIVVMMLVGDSYGDENDDYDNNEDAM